MNSLQNAIRKFLPNKESQHRLLIYFVIVLIFLGSFCRPDYATDTYAYARGDFADITGNFLRCGRIFTAGIYTALRLLSADIRLVNILCFVIAIISLTLALYVLEKLLHKNFIKNKFWAFILPLVILLNPLIIEFFLFIEKGIMCFSILCCVLSAYYYNDYLNSHCRSSLFKVIALNLLATFLYQGVVGVFIILATMITVLKSRSWKVFFQNTILSVALYIVGPIVNLIMIKLFFSSGRAGGSLNLIASTKVILENLYKLFNIFDVIPPILFWGFLCIIVLCWTYHLYQTSTFKPLPYLQIVYLSIVILLASIAPQVALQPEGVWLAPRSTYPFATLVGVYMVVIGSTSPQFFNLNPRKSILAFLILCLAVVQFYSFNRIMIDHYAIAAIDRLRAQSLGRLIWEFEAENNTQITKIAVARDGNMTYGYPGIRTLLDSNISAFNTDWSDVTNISYWNNRDFERIAPPAEWEQYCASQDWLEYSDDQVKLSDDTLYLCVF